MLSRKAFTLAVVAALIAVLLHGACPALGADVPQAISYQGRLTDSSGQIVPDGPYQVQFKLYTADLGGTPFWTSANQNVTTSGGVFTTQIQPLTPADLAGKTEVWLEVAVSDPIGSYTPLSPRVRLLSAPYALRAGDLSLPFTSTITSATDAFTVINHGGTAIKGFVGGPGIALWGHAAGDGRPAYFEATSPNNLNEALFVRTYGRGSAGSFIVGNPDNNSPALWVRTNGGGAAVSGFTAGSGSAGRFELENPTSNSPALYVTTNGLGPAGQFNGTAEMTGFKMPTGAGKGKVLTSDASGKGTWGTDGLALPFYGSYDGGISALTITNMGSGQGVSCASYGTDALIAAAYGEGRAASLVVVGNTNPSEALYVQTTGLGKVGCFTADNEGNPSPALYALTYGTGRAAEFYASNRTSDNSALLSATEGRGGAAEFFIDNPSNLSPAIHATTNGTGTTLVADHTGASGNIAAFQSGGVNKATIDKSGNANFSGAVEMTGFAMPTGAGNEKVLTSDASGNGTWETPPTYIGGSGTANRIPVFSGSTTLANSVIYQSGNNLGIAGNISPAVPLSFPSSLGDKISLYQFGSTHFGFGVQSNLMQVYTSLSSTDIAFGYGSSAAFTERVRIKGTGDVGIGTPTPGSRLDVNGTATVTGFVMPTGAGDRKVLTSDGSGVGRWQGIGAAGGWALSGNAGTVPGTDFIGTTDDKAFEIKVHGKRALRVEPIYGTVNVVAGDAGNAVTDGAEGATIAGGGVSTSPNKVTDHYGVVGGGVGNVAGSDNGNVGGAVAATVAGGEGNWATEDAAAVGGGAGNWASGAVSAIAGGGDNRATGLYSTVPGGLDNVAAGDYSFAAGQWAKASHQGSFVWSDSSTVAGTYFESTSPNQFLVNATGGVGINKTSPASTLDVAGTATVAGFRMPTGAGAGKVLTSDASGGGTWQVNNSLDASDGSPVNAVYVDAAGKVGIGMTNPSVLFEVNGNARVDGNLCATGTIGACSDARYKKDVKALRDGLGKVERLRPVSFNWKQDEYPEQSFSDREQIGLIAQEVKEILPEVVTQGGDGYYQIDYARLTPVLVQAIKEQQKQIDELKMLVGELARGR